MDINDFKKALRTGAVHFSYKKKDGTIRDAYGTLCKALTPDADKPEVVKFKCSDIVWDKEDEDGNVCELGPKMTVELDADDVKRAESEGGDALDDLVVNALSEKSGWLVESFSYAKHEPKKLAAGTIFYYDLDKDGYRSFNESQLIDWKEFVK